MADEYDFTEDWFSNSIPIWEQLFASWRPSRFVEIGSFEGRSMTYVIERIGRERGIEAWCIDTWSGGVEHSAIDWGAVEARFDRNIARALAKAPHAARVEKLKGPSSEGLARLLLDLGRESVDFVFVDGSHQAPDVLSDAVMAFHLLRVGGLMIFDDYIWSEGADMTRRDPLEMPKPGVDAFMNLHTRKMALIWGGPVQHLTTQKIAS